MAVPLTDSAFCDYLSNSRRSLYALMAFEPLRAMTAISLVGSLTVRTPPDSLLLLFFFLRSMIYESAYAFKNGGQLDFASRAKM